MIKQVKIGLKWSRVIRRFFLLLFGLSALYGYSQQDVENWESLLKEGKTLMMDGEYRKATERFFTSYKLLEPNLDQERTKATTSLYFMGKAFALLGEFGQALNYLHGAIENILIEKKGKSHPHYGEILKEYIQIYKTIGDHRNALSTIILSEFKIPGLSPDQQKAINLSYTYAWYKQVRWGLLGNAGNDFESILKWKEENYKQFIQTYRASSRVERNRIEGIMKPIAMAAQKATELSRLNQMEINDYYSPFQPRHFSNSWSVNREMSDIQEKYPDFPFRLSLLVFENLFKIESQKRKYPYDLYSLDQIKQEFISRFGEKHSLVSEFLYLEGLGNFYCGSTQKAEAKFREVLTKVRSKESKNIHLEAKTLAKLAECLILNKKEKEASQIGLEALEKLDISESKLFPNYHQQSFKILIETALLGLKHSWNGKKMDQDQNQDVLLEYIDAERERIHELKASVPRDVIGEESHIRFEKAFEKLEARVAAFSNNQSIKNHLPLTKEDNRIMAPPIASLPPIRVPLPDSTNVSDAAMKVKSWKEGMKQGEKLMDSEDYPGAADAFYKSYRSLDNDQPDFTEKAVPALYQLSKSVSEQWKYDMALTYLHEATRLLILKGNARMNPYYDRIMKHYINLYKVLGDIHEDFENLLLSVVSATDLRSPFLSQQEQNRIDDSFLYLFLLLIQDQKKLALDYLKKLHIPSEFFIERDEERWQNRIFKMGIEPLDMKKQALETISNYVFGMEMEYSLGDPIIAKARELFPFFEPYYEFYHHKEAMMALDRNVNDDIAPPWEIVFNLEDKRKGFIPKIGQNHDLNIRSLNSLGNVYSIIGMNDKALSLYEEALQLLEGSGSQNFTLLEELNLNIASHLLDYRRFEEVGALLKKVQSNLIDKMVNSSPLYEEYYTSLLSRTQRLESRLKSELGKTNNVEMSLGYYNFENQKEYSEEERKKQYELYQEEQYDWSRGYPHPINRNLHARAAVLMGVKSYSPELEERKEEYMKALEKSRLMDLSWARKDFDKLLRYLPFEIRKEYLELLLETEEVYEYNLSKSDPELGNLYSILAETYERIGSLELALQYYLKVNDNLIAQVKEIFTFSNEEEKKDFIEKLSGNFNYLKAAGYREQKDLSLNEINLNNELLLKNLLLNTSRDLLTSLKGLKEVDVEKKLAHFEQVRELWSSQMTLPKAVRQIDTDSLAEVKVSLEKSLVKIYSERFGESVDYTRNWRLIQDELGPEELAIEFSHYTTNKKKEARTFYQAYLIHKDWETPKRIPLFEANKLKELLAGSTPNTLYKVRGSVGQSIKVNQASVYELIWKPIEDYLQDIETVYYAPSGMLHQIPLAALSRTESEILGNQYDLVQLSSTSLVGSLTQEVQTNTSLLVGGVQYDYMPTSKQKSTDASEGLSVLLESKAGANRSRGESWNYLPGTDTEVENLKALYEQRQLNYSALSGPQASETNFKALSGNSPNILHIATHGFFFENRENTLTDPGSLGSSVYKYANDPLIRSGLVLSGANYAWKNGNNPYQEEDGILTALEISNLDLSQTDMVILSACETGLGDIEGNEGVYGLQRSFKMAGVDILVMSLWEVPDQETAEFMGLFYTQWLQDKNVRAAFLDTQRQMAKKYQDTPEKWAAFVLVE
ncbi:CHAT domain-containing protein [Robiginitalea sp. IMCC44478]|uniref:CHAT domain-containing protein n=1 Tax=Robiginitalea sp. IMCC44478 TaxID=3459122 RepID=UPI00404137EC